MLAVLFVFFTYDLHTVLQKIVGERQRVSSDYSGGDPFKRALESDYVLIRLL